MLLTFPKDSYYIEGFLFSVCQRLVLNFWCTCSCAHVFAGRQIKSTTTTTTWTSKRTNANSFVTFSWSRFSNFSALMVFIYGKFDGGKLFQADFMRKTFQHFKQWMQWTFLPLLCGKKATRIRRRTCKLEFLGTIAPFHILISLTFSHFDCIGPVSFNSTI